MKGAIANSMLGRFIKRAAEKYVNRYYEGPDPPERLRELVAIFVDQYPKAHREQWIEFASELADEAYRSGYARGYEYTERTYDWRNDLPPEVLADMHDPNWKVGRGIQIEEAGGTVPLDPPTEEDILRSQSQEIFMMGARSK